MGDCWYRTDKKESLFARAISLNTTIHKFQLVDT